MLVTLPFHHVVLRLAEKSVLRAKQGRQMEQITGVSLENSRRVFKLRGNGSRMKQRTNARPVKFLQPKFA
jgi:hypothetical protein